MKTIHPPFTLILFASLLTLSAFAGADKGGNGGKGVYCDLPNGTRKLFLLDYVRDYGDQHLRMQYASGADETEKALNLVKRIEAFDPVRAATYEHKIVNFLDLKNLHKVPHLSDEVRTPDSHELTTCVNPGTVQIVIQYPSGRHPKPWEEQKDFVLDESRWNDLDADQRAGLMIHEIALSEVIDITEVTDPIMWFNAQLAGNLIQTQASYEELRKEVGLPDFSTVKTIEQSIRNRLGEIFKVKDPEYFANIVSATDVTRAAFQKGLGLAKSQYSKSVVFPKDLAQQIIYSVPRHSLFNSYATYQFPGMGKTTDSWSDHYPQADWEKQIQSLSDGEGIEFTFGYRYGELIGDYVCLMDFFGVLEDPKTVKLAP